MSPRYQPRYARSRALVIGVNTYAALPPLDGAVHDAEGIARALQDELGFDEVTLLRDQEATRDAILSAIESLTDCGPDDRALAFFAGHGLTRATATGGEVGMIAPHDMESPRHFHQAIEMDYLIDRSKFIPAKHILFVLDACFSGLAVTRSSAASDRLLEDLMSRRAVQAIAAGQKDQQVADRWGSGGHSIFTGALLDRITQRGLLTGNELGVYLQRTVGTHTHSRQTPHFGHLIGSEGGDFVIRAERTIVELPADLRAAIANPLPGVREGAISELVYLLARGSADHKALARTELERLALDDSRKVSEAAQRALGGTPVTEPSPSPMPAPAAPVVQPEPDLQVSKTVSASAPAKRAAPVAKPTGTKTHVWRSVLGFVAGALAIHLGTALLVDGLGPAIRFVGNEIVSPYNWLHGGLAGILDAALLALALRLNGITMRLGSWLLLAASWAFLMSAAVLISVAQ